MMISNQLEDSDIWADDFSRSSYKFLWNYIFAKLEEGCSIKLALKH